MRSTLAMSFCAGLAATTTANAAMTQPPSIITVTQVQYRAQGVDANGDRISVTVSDLYLTSSNSDDVILNVFDANISNSVGADSYYQSVIGETWNPLRSNAATQAWQRLDSFVTIGGIDATSGAFGTYQELVASSHIDPSFGGATTPAPETNAGWFNSNPANLNGQVGDTEVGIGLFLGRFSLEDSPMFHLEGEVSVTWNKGLQTSPHQGTFEIEMGTVTAVPGVGGILLFAATPIRRRRRRH